MAEDVTEPGPRRRSASATREAILESATRRFACQGYERSGAREIAADAGVTAALVNRYFGSKEALFAEVIARAFNSRALLDGPREGLAARLAHRMVITPSERPDSAQIPLILLLRSATEPSAAEVLRQNLEQNFIKPLAALLEGPDAEVRAGLIASHLTGFAIMDQMIQTEVFKQVNQERLVALLIAMMNVYLEPSSTPVETPKDHGSTENKPG